MRWLCCVLVVLCAATASAQDDLPWWRTANFYQVYPRSFKDSDGDGVGDLKGITQMATYFKDIGVDAIWLSPIQESPMVDFGYDISNYTRIDPLFGTMEDFEELAKTLEGIGIKLVVDFVPNHSSDQHPWFQKSVAKEEPYTNFYVWVDGKRDAAGKPQPPNNWLSVFSGPAWEWNDARQQFYFHDFVKQQPDLNYRNETVKEAMKDVIKFWLDLGVDGFRLDSANYMYEVKDVSEDEPPVPGTNGSQWDELIHNCTQNLPETYYLLEEWANIFYEYSVMVGGKPRSLFIEAYTDLDHTIEYYGKGNTSLMQPFNFRLLVNGNQSSRAPEIKQLIDEWMAALPEGDVANWVIGNHDNGRVADRYGPEMVDALNLLTMVLPGIKVTYNGEEIGMQNTFIRWDQTVDPSGILLGPYRYLEATRDPERTPMQWDSSVSSGFSTNSTTWLPVNPNYWWLNVAAQKAAESSHLKVFQTMAMARKDPVLLRGNLTVLSPDNDTLVVIRSYNGSYFLLLVNFGSEVSSYTSEDMFALYGLDMDMAVVVTSVNSGSGYKAGASMKQGSLNVTLRPKAAILLQSLTTASSSGTGLFGAGSLLICGLVAVLRR